MHATVIRNACVIPMDGTTVARPRADIHVDDRGTIAAVGEDLVVPPDVTEVDAAGMIALPGLVDSHRHPWQTLMRGVATDFTVIQYRDILRGGAAPRYRPEDVYWGTLLGDLEALAAGVTTVADLAHIMNSPEHADAAVQAHRDSGMRVLFAHGTPNDGRADLWYSRSELPHPADIRRVREQVLRDDSALVTLGMHMRPSFLVSDEVMRSDFRLARDLDVHVSVDGGLGGGCWGGARWGSPGRRPVRDLDEAGFLGPRVTLVHCNNLPDEEMARIGRSGTHVSVSPDAEMNCGHGEPATLRLLGHGVRPGLSVDSVVWAAGDMFTAMRAVLNSARGTLGARSYETGVPVDEWSITAWDVLEFATVRGAAACGLGERTGSLSPGKAADIVLLRSDPLNLEPLNHPVGQVVMTAHPGNVDTVYVQGRRVKSAGRLLGQDTASVTAKARAARDHVLGGLDPAVSAVRRDSPWAWV